ncbi:MAG: hypothetical protein KF854_12790 [Nitrospira sp.]|nr:hypothetical protein [Nitrospira sp.]HMW70108.1 hypothetical protein [Nitrosomonas sp.]HMY91440.1 hypothetical protein [Nitrosomonas sp.]HNA71643.1 hypothetical protein [Nitrosomonas sp.]HNA84621.1 hypothetical protein [Nitrospira sp.]
MNGLGPHGLNGLFVVLNDSKIIFYDTSDSPTLQNEALEISDAYFKRSYVNDLIPVQYKSRVHPLGLNYELYVGSLNHYEVARFVFRKHLLHDFPKELCVRIAELLSLSFLPTVVNMAAPPINNQDPQVLFMARAWDPSGEGIELSTEQKVERREINETRARCIDLLRKEFGSRFYGGFARTAYAMDNYGHLLLGDALVSGKKNYIALLRQYPICIATTGLHGSIGWKMAEYVAFSKAIVSEKLRCEVPGNFDNGKNYFEFSTPEECLQETTKLFENRELRSKMMQTNWMYYQSHLAPDQLIMRTLNIAGQS